MAHRSAPCGSCKTSSGLPGTRRRASRVHVGKANCQLAFAVVISLLARLDETSAVWRGQFDPVLDHVERRGAKFVQALDCFVDANDFKAGGARGPARQRTDP